MSFSETPHRSMPCEPCAKLKALPFQWIETAGAIVLKRGSVEFKVTGTGAAEGVRLVLLALSKDGGATEEEICALFALRQRDIVKALLQRLQTSRFVLPIHDQTHRGELPEAAVDVFYWHFGQCASSVEGKLNRHRLVVAGVNCISRQLLVSLRASGMENFEVVDDPILRNRKLFNEAGSLKDQEWPSVKPPLEFEKWKLNYPRRTVDCLIATCDYGGPLTLMAWNTDCVQSNRKFLPVFLQDCIGYIGPMIIPGETACLECFKARQVSHLTDPRDRHLADVAAFEGQQVTGFHPSMASILGDLATFELVRFYGDVLPFYRVGTVIEVNLLSTKLQARKVLKIPRCPVCSPLNSNPSSTALRDAFQAVAPENK